ncbi:MAG: MipA/OmpV family protein [Moraxellaceae bacterium]|nr:MAG: MipA/OmpV family protein [Moraxellaceae bacterium]
MRKYFWLIILVLNTHAFADDSPEKKWELGLGVGDISGSDYRGSDEYHHFVAPIPYIIYHGKYLQSDRDGVRGNFFKSDLYEFTFSATATITPRPEQNIARANMPLLGSTIELGPTVNIKITGQTFHDGLTLQVPLHAVIAVTGDNRGYQGLLFQPQFMYQKQFTDWQFTQRLGVGFASENYHNYYYSVDDKFVTADRSSFDSHGGYNGVFAQSAFSRSIRISHLDTKVGFFVRYENLEGVAFENSPLVKTDHVWRTGFAFIWVIQ